MRNREGWEVKTLGEVCEVLNGFAFKSSKYVDSGIRVIRITNVQKGVIVDESPQFYPLESMSELSKFMLKEDDLLLSLTGNVGRVGLLQEYLLPAALNQRVACLRIRNAEFLSKRFLFQFLNSDFFEDLCIRSAKGIAQKNLSTKWLSDFTLPIPPLPIQHQIVAELDTLNSIIDKKKEQLNELDNLAQATFYDMFGDPVENEKGWEVNKLGELSKVMTGATPSRRKEEEYYNGSIYWVKTTEVHNVQITSTEEKITELALKETNCKIFPVNTILLAMYGQGKTRGSVGLLQVEAATNQACAAILPNELADQVFLYELLKHSYNHLRSLSRGGNQENLNLSIVRGVDIILPPLSLQTQFAEKIKHIEKQKALIQRSIDDVQQLFDYTMDKYFN